MNLLDLFISGIFTHNIILYYFLGICPFVGVSNKEKNAFGMGVCVLFVTVFSSIICYLMYYNVLIKLNSEYLITILFILIIATLVQVVDIIIKKFFKSLHKSFGIYLPLITTNCAVFGIVLLNINNEYNFLEMIVSSFSSSLGFLLVIYIFSTIREKLDNSPVPKYFKGYPIALITASIMAMVFSRFVIS